MTEGIVRLLLFILLCMGLPPVAALEITDDFLQKYSVDLSKETLLLHDPDNRLSPETVAGRMSQPDFRSDKMFAAARQYWFYIPLINRTSAPQWTIRADHNLYDELGFYVYCQGQALQPIPRPTLGLDSPTLATAYFIPVTLPKDTACGFLQRGQTPVFDGVRINLVPYEKMVWQSNLKTTLTLLGMGVVIGLTLYNFLLYLSLRNSMYLIYIVYAVLHLASAVLLHFNPEPLNSLFTSGRHAFSAMGNVTMIFFVLFTLRFMQPGIQQLRNNPTKKRLLILINTFVYINWLAAALMLLVLLSTLFYPDSLSLFARAYPIIYMSSILFIPVPSLLVALSGYKPAWVFLPAWTILVVSHILLILDGLRIIDLQGLAPTYTVLAAAMEMVLLSIALGMTLRGSQLARDRAQMARENAELLMGRKDKFISTLSHEIRTPLYAMLGSNTRLGRTALSEEQKDYWSTTHYAAESMYELVDNLLDRTQAKQAQLRDKSTTFDPQRLLEAMVSLLRNRAEEKKLSLHLHTGTLPKHLEGNPVILRRVLINVISNAVKYTDAGDIEVDASWSSEPPALHVTVRDSGRGMSTQQLRQVHRSFNMGVEALYSQQASSGLGLPICFEMLQEAGGHLALDSQPGQGTVVSFSLAMSLPTLPVGLPADTPLSVAETALAVLVVDDVEVNRCFTAELLQSAGHQVSCAESGEQALALMQGQPFDAVLSDVRMPGMGGVQLLAQLRREHSPEELVIVMTSAHFDQQQRDTLLAMGATACLAKSHDPHPLLTAIQGIPPENNPPTSTMPAAAMHLSAEKSAQIRGLYDRQLKEDITRIQQALEQQDFGTIRIAAHRIVSASRALGLQGHAEAALQIETYGEGKTEPDWEAFRRLIARQMQQLYGQPTQ